jgi:hypothetical protein
VVHDDSSLDAMADAADGAIDSVVLSRFAHESRPRAGEKENGDRAVAFERDGRLILAVIDGLGHGPQASAAASAAAAEIGRADFAGGPAVVVRAVHEALRGTRGAVMTLVMVGESAIETCGVGNVALRLSGGIKHSFIPNAGVLGHNLRVPRTARSARVRGRIILHSDGISSRFDPDAVRELDPAAACARILAEHRRDVDDSTVLVADV